MRHQFESHRRVSEEAAECRLQVVEVEAVDAKAKAMIDFQNAMFAAAFCRRDNGRCEGCGE